MKGNKLTIYLAGKMTGLNLEEMNNWRVQLTSLLEDCAKCIDVPITVINPVNYYNFDEPRHQSEAEIMQFDINKVRNSDVVIVNLKGLSTSIGTIIELYEAKKLNIPVIVYNPFGNMDYSQLHPWIQCCVTRVENNMSDIKEYVRDFYML